jgi:tetratricopeptide (TPR) repeat protein
VDRGRRPSRRPPAPAPLADHHEDLAKALSPSQAAKADKALREAARAFERERFQDARKILAPVAERAPSVPAVRELLGLTYYRLGRWKQAAKELEAFRTLTGSTEQHPVLADCYRALERWDQVDELWDELRQASPGADLVTEGRIVAAGALADRGRLREAITLLGKQWQVPKRPKEHHLRRAYALADLYERAGDVPHARELFGRIQRADADFADVGTRLRGLA